jgi:ribosomal protein S18 acetylase RimI-like enzyme
MTSSFNVRPAEPGDIGAIGRLGALLVAEHHDFDPRRFLAPRPDMAELYGRFLGSQMEQPDKLVLVAELDGAVAGYAYAGVEGNDYMALRGPAGVIYDLVVDPDHRRQGIGSALLDAAQAALAERGEPRAVLSTAERNAGAQRMFEKAGFRRTMIEMTRELTGESPDSGASG